jgi:hypothetical protein
MPSTLTAHDLWPLVTKLSRGEQVRLAKLALRAASQDPETDAHAYRSKPPTADELSSDDDPLAWEPDGWDQVDAPR